MGYGHELANYGEYSGAPSEDQTFEYARTILKLMGSVKLHDHGDGGSAAGGGGGEATTAAGQVKGKVLIIGGGIANFTDVAKTFTGIIRALREASAMLHEHNVSIWVRRGGPNYQEGLRLMAQLGEEIGVPIHVYGPDTHITAIVPMALGVEDVNHLRVAPELHPAPSMDIFSPPAAQKPAGGAAAPAHAGAGGKPPVARTMTPSSSFSMGELPPHVIPRADRSGSSEGPTPSAARTASPGASGGIAFGSKREGSDTQISKMLEVADPAAPYNLFTPTTRCLVYGTAACGAGDA